MSLQALVTKENNLMTLIKSNFFKSYQTCSENYKAWLSSIWWSHRVFTLYYLPSKLYALFFCPWNGLQKNTISCKRLHENLLFTAKLCSLTMYTFIQHISSKFQNISNFWPHTFSNFSCRFLNPNCFFQFEF